MSFVVFQVCKELGQLWEELGYSRQSMGSVKTPIGKEVEYIAMEALLNWQW